MPFGSADRAQLQKIINQLGKLATDLAALKQQVADQQHAIDQARLDANTAISTGLAEVRSAVTSLDRQITAQAATQPTAPEPEPAPAESEPEPQQEAEPAAEPDPDILRAAAGIAHATLEAHRDTWAILIQIAGNEKHFHIPGRVKDHNGFVKVRFSGPSIVAAITSLGRISHTDPNLNTRAIAHHIHGKITAAVQTIIDNPHHKDGKPIRIVIDDRPAHDDQPAKR